MTLILIYTCSCRPPPSTSFPYTTLFRSFARFLDRRVNDSLRERFLATLHDRGNEACNRRTPVAGIDSLLLFVNLPPSRHCRSFYPKLFLFRSAFSRCGRFLCGRFRCARTAPATFRALRPIFGAATATSIDAKAVERSAHNVITYAW